MSFMVKPTSTLSQFPATGKSKELDFSSCHDAVIHLPLTHHTPKRHVRQWWDRIFWNIVLFIFFSSSFLSFVLIPLKHLCCSVFIASRGGISNRGRNQQQRKKRIWTSSARVVQVCVPSEEQIKKPRYSYIKAYEERWIPSPVVQPPRPPTRQKCTGLWGNRRKTARRRWECTCR